MAQSRHAYAPFMQLVVNGFFFFSAPPPTDIYTLSLHDALPISRDVVQDQISSAHPGGPLVVAPLLDATGVRSEEHTSELQSHSDLVCRLLLEKKKNS